MTMTEAGVSGKAFPLESVGVFPNQRPAPKVIITASAQSVTSTSPIIRPVARYIARPPQKASDAMLPECGAGLRFVLFLFVL